MTRPRPAPARGRRGRALCLLIALCLALSGCSAGMMRSPSLPENPNRHVAIVAGHALRYCAQRPLEEWPASVTRVIVAVHGIDRNPCGMLAAVTDALGDEARGDAPEVAVIAPAFSGWADAAPGGHAWDARGWPAGENSSTGWSSYAVMDALIEALGTRQVTLAGFSAGGQFVNRYAAVSPHTVHRYVVMNPSSYLWFTPDRPTDSPCAGANVWRFGLDGRRGYPARVDAATILARYSSREVRYLIGTADDDPKSVTMDRSCGAMAQGPDRDARAMNYHRHLVDVFGSGIEARQPLTVVPGVGHDARAMLASPEGRAALQG